MTGLKNPIDGGHMWDMWKIINESLRYMDFQYEVIT